MAWQKCRAGIDTAGGRVEGRRGETHRHEAEVDAGHGHPFAVERAAVQAVDVIKKDHFPGGQLQRREIMGAGRLLHMQRRTAGHRREGADRIQFIATVAEIGIAVIATNPAITWQPEAIGGNALHVAGLADQRIDHAAA